jgi:mono/diheme cytochrome c family protein
MRHIRLLVLALPALAVQAQEPDLGEMLYQNHCTECHESTLHVREQTKVGNRADLEAYVRQWSDYKQLGWSDTERDAVRDYLNQSFYGFFESTPPPPPPAAPTN